MIGLTQDGAAAAVRRKIVEVPVVVCKIGATAAPNRFRIRAMAWRACSIRRPDRSVASVVEARDHGAAARSAAVAGVEAFRAAAAAGAAAVVAVADSADSYNKVN